MKPGACDGFWEGGEEAWWSGLHDALRSASNRLKTAQSDDEREAAQAALDELKQQEAEAERNGDHWLF